MTRKRDVIMVLRVKPDGTQVQLLPDGSEAPYELPPIDWAAIDAKSDAELTADAESDPDNPPLDASTLASLEAGGRLKRLRRRLRLSQRAFADRFGIPVTSLRDWEQGRAAPTPVALSYLRVIERAPDFVAKALV